MCLQLCLCNYKENPVSDSEAPKSVPPRSRLFEYAVIYHPRDKHKPAELVVPPTTILAPDRDIAVWIAARAIPEDYADRLDRMEVAVRPF